MTQKGIRQLHEGVCRAVPPADPAQDAHHQAGKVDADWVQIPNTKDERGKYLHHRGVSPAENLFFMGRPWQTCRASALISGLERDSAMILGKLPPVPPQLASAAAE